MEDRHGLVKRVVIFSFIGFLALIAMEVIELDGVSKWDIACFVAGAAFIIKILPISNLSNKMTNNESNDVYREKDDTPDAAGIFLFMMAFVVVALIAKGICFIGRFLIWPMIVIYIVDIVVILYLILSRLIRKPS